MAVASRAVARSSAVVASVAPWPQWSSCVRVSVFFVVGVFESASDCARRYGSHYSRKKVWLKLVKEHREDNNLCICVCSQWWLLWMIFVCE